MTRLRICLIASEVAPFAKTGGLADVAAGLARHLHTVGHDVRVFMPLYRRVREAGHELVAGLGTPTDGRVAAGKATAGKAAADRTTSRSALKMQLGPRSFPVGFWTTAPRDPGVGPSTHGTAAPPLPPVHFVDCPELYDRDAVYADGGDEHIRFALLTRAAIEACQRLQWAPQVFHCNDWHTGLLPLYLRTAYAWDRLFASTRTLMTIHNIGYQGTFDSKLLADLGLMEERRHLDQKDLGAGFFSFLKIGIERADAVSTVSRTYAAEIRTTEFGMGLDGVLERRRDALHGIVNGVDYHDWNPATDTRIPARYSPEDLTGKLENKRRLLERFELPFDERVPVIGVVSRLTNQKGFELLPTVLSVLLQQEDVRLVVLGNGEQSHQDYFQWLRDTWPQKVGFYRGYHDELAHWIEAGADLFLMPSRYEPCGLNQMYSLKYGTPPIVRRTGGLADTVDPFDAATGAGTGFVFEEFTSEALFGAIRSALAVWRRPADWRRLMANGMARDFSWTRQGAEYEALYRSLGAGASG